MRWDLIDSFEILKKNEFSRAKKTFTGKEDFFQEHYPGNPVVPGPLMLEIMAQAGGVLYGLHLDFKKEVILAKIENARFGSPVIPPCDLMIEAMLKDQREEGAWIEGKVTHRGAVAASAEILLVSIEALNSGFPGKIVFNENFLSHYNILDVARKSEGILF